MTIGADASGAESDKTVGVLKSFFSAMARKKHDLRFGGHAFLIIHRS
jgi:hypothetical protein